MPIQVRWGDMDPFGHVNNVAFFQYFEVGRIAYLDQVGFREGGDIAPILASTWCRFRRPLSYPDFAWVGVRVVRVEEDRFTHQYRLVSERSGEMSAHGEGIVVAYDYRRGAKALLPTEVVAAIERTERTR